MNRKPLKAWEIEKGVIIKTKKRAGFFTEKQFRLLIKTNHIKVKTNKGLEYIQNTY